MNTSKATQSGETFLWSETCIIQISVAILNHNHNWRQNWLQLPKNHNWLVFSSALAQAPTRSWLLLNQAHRYYSLKTVRFFLRRNGHAHLIKRLSSGWAKCFKGQLLFLQWRKNMELTLNCTYKKILEYSFFFQISLRRKRIWTVKIAGDNKSLHESGLWIH